MTIESSDAINSLGKANVYTPDTVSNKIMATHIAQKLYNLSERYDTKFEGVELIVHWKYLLTDEQSEKIINAGLTEELIQDVLKETNKNLLNIIDHPAYKITTKEHVGVKLSDGLFISRTNKDVVIRVTPRSDEVSKRAMWIQYTEYGYDDYEFKSPLKTWLEIHDKKGGYVRLMNNICESNRHGKIQVYVIETSRIIREINKTRVNRENRIG